MTNPIPPKLQSQHVTSLRWAIALLSGNSVIGKAFRFAIIGALSAATFGIVTSLLIDCSRLDDGVAGVLGYIVAAPFNFLGNRRFAFRSEGAVAGDVIRFASVHLANLGVTAMLMWLNRSFGQHYAWGVLAVVVVIPVINFFLMNFWVFAANRPKVINEPPSAREKL